MTGAPQDADRYAQVVAGLAGVRARIADACVAAGRSPDDVTLVVVTKTFPASDVRHLAACGVRDVGENRDQEAREKARACTGLDLRWHFVGRLQTNKASSVATYADVVHSVDRLRLVGALDRAAASRARRLTCLLQVSLDGDQERGGAPAEDLTALADALASSSSLALGGVMAVAPLGEDPERAFARLAVVSDRLRGFHPDATMISAGMSADLEAAVACGATHVRVGSAVLGNRPPLR